MWATPLSDDALIAICVQSIALVTFVKPVSLFSLLFHAGQAAIKLPSAEASKWAQCMSPGQYTPYIKGIMKTP